ncbi:MAG: 3-isopropylmalate dehydratase [Candidatus Heimdallarchaeota archaeon]|nr:MAG: 3-isopropylmalate dehydratase [Candidatus Heimdallarchaeota archaeon]
MKFTGKIWIFPDDDINTDVIFPGKYTYEPLTPEQMAEHAMEDYLPNFAKEVTKGDIIVAGKNFGCGSSREQAVICLAKAGLSCIIAKSFARIFYRNAINQALPLVISFDCSDYVIRNRYALKDGEISVDFDTGVIKLQDKEFLFPKLDSQALEIFKAGGLVEYTKKRLQSL